MKFSFGKNEHKCKFLKGGSKLLLMTVITRYFSKVVASYSPVHLTCEKKTIKAIY